MKLCILYSVFPGWWTIRKVNMNSLGNWGNALNMRSPGVEDIWNSSGVESKIVELFGGKTLILREFFRGEQRFHGIFRVPSQESLQG